jgi:hypothetical protein
MKELKSELVNSAGNMPFESKVVADFQSWISFGGYALRSLGIWSLGIGYDFNSTGGRISSGDYSGKYLFDELLQCHSFGLINSFRIGADFGYMFDYGGTIMPMSGRKVPYDSNWSGFRIGINIGLFPGELFRKKDRTVPKSSPTG